MTAFDSDEVLKRFLESTIGADTDLPAARLAHAPLPAGVKAYLRAHLRERLSEELGRAPSFNRVRALSPSAARLQHLFIEQAAESYIYPRGEFQADLENAVHFTGNYVCRPRWTLSSFLFHTRDVIQVSDLFAKLEYVTDYVYLPQLLRKTLAAKGQRDIDRATCTELIRRIDAAVTKEHAPRELAALARPLFEFYRTGAQDGTQEIPLRPVILFFEDKEMVGVKEYITGILHLRNRDAITLEDLAALCEDFLEPKNEAPPANETEPGARETATLPEAANEQPGAQTSADPAASMSTEPAAAEAPLAEPEDLMQTPVEVLPEEAPDDPVDADREMTAAARAVENLPALPEALENTPAVEAGPPSAETTAIVGPPVPAAGEPVLSPLQDAPAEAASELMIGDPGMDIEAPASGRARSHAHRTGPDPGDQLELPLALPRQAPLPDLTVVIMPEQRKRFVNVLCDRDAQFYDLMIARLNQMDSWQEATGYVREIFEINSIDPFRDEAIEFTDVIQQRFATGTGTAA
jgi:hypothetical protein